MQFVVTNVSNAVSDYVEAFYNCEIRLLRYCLIEYKQSSIEGVQLDWLAHINYTRIENAHKVRNKTFVVLLYIEVQQTYNFPFFLLRHYQMPECFHVNNCVAVMIAAIG